MILEAKVQNLQQKLFQNHVYLNFKYNNFTKILNKKNQIHNLVQLEIQITNKEISIKRKKREKRAKEIKRNRNSKKKLYQKT